MNLKDKVVLVTGSSTGIGKETAIKFAQKGAKVVVTYNKGKKEGEKVLKECQKYSEAILVHLDVKDDRSIRQAVKEVIKEFGRLDILVNNAGVSRKKDLVKHSQEDIEEQININLLGLIKVTRAFLTQFYFRSPAFCGARKDGRPRAQLGGGRHKQKKGIIINIASGAGKQGFTQYTVYCATKFGVRGFTQALAQELPQDLRIYCVNPGMTATRMTNYRGVNPSKVAEVIVATAEEKLGKRTGNDIDVWEYL